MMTIVRLFSCFAFRFCLCVDMLAHFAKSVFPSGMMNVAAGDRVLVNGFKGKYLKVSLPDGSRKGFLPPKIVQDGKAMYDTLLAEELRATGETQ